MSNGAADKLIWANTSGFRAQPSSHWIYMISRPLLSPDQQMLYRAYKYDGSLPYGYQSPVDLGQYPYIVDAQNALQADWDASGVQSIVTEPPANGAT